MNTYDYKVSVDRWLLKDNIDEKKHLMWKFGGVPCMNKAIYDFLRPEFDYIGIKTNKGRKFVITADKFDEYKKEIEFKEPQYYVEKALWQIIVAT